jgi:tripartite-type tricarboxylate transporter receptor subunit TctC
MRFPRALLAIAMCGAIPASAEEYPSRSIRIIVSTSAGGITDVAARVVGQDTTVRTGRTVVINNRAGAGDTLRWTQSPRRAGNRQRQARRLSAGRAHPHRAGLPRIRVRNLVCAVCAARHAEAARRSAERIHARPAEDPDSRKRLEAFLEPIVLTAAQFADQVKADAAKWERIVRESGVKQD